MKLVNSQNRIKELMSRFVVQVEMGAVTSSTDLNKTAETILIPLLNEVYGWKLENINYVEDNNNYPGIDLADAGVGVSVQVTATPTFAKVKHTLEKFTKHSQYLKYNRLIIFLLKKKRASYSENTIQNIIQNRFNFDSRKDIWDYNDIIKEVSNFQIDKTLRVQEILEANFGDNSGLAASVSSSLEQEIDWEETCRELLNHWKGLATNVLTTPNGVRFQLDEIFVPLGVVERRQKPRYSPIGSSPEKGSELYEEKVTPISQDDFFEQVLRQRQSKHSQGRRIAIIGEPGAGKTTQLQKMGDWILKENDIPIWIPLAGVGIKPLQEYLLNDWLKTAIQELEVSQQHRDDLGQLLKTGKVWLLLDGVDEMAIPDALHHIATQMREGWLRNVRVVLTCRVNVWDAGKNALDGFDVYRNLDFDYPTEVHRFVDKWFVSEPELQSKLKVALEQSGKERIRDMVKNPLRLTLLCYSWQLRQGELPETKAGLYEWFVDAFYEWNKGKVPTKLNVTRRKELNATLGELAKEAIDQESSRFRLREKFVSQFLGDTDDEDSLFYLALQLGWLNRIGVAEENPLEDVYAFFHPTFQEYFAALAIDDWDYFLPCEHIDKPVKGKKYRIFESHWKEVILLWAGCRNDEYKVEELIRKLITLKDNCGGYFICKSYFISSAITSEFRSDLSEEIAIKLIEWRFDLSDANFPSSKSIEFERTKALLEGNRNIVVNELTHRIQSGDSIHTRLKPLLIQLNLKEKRIVNPFTRDFSSKKEVFVESERCSENSSDLQKLPFWFPKPPSWNSRDLNNLGSIIIEAGTFEEMINRIDNIETLISLLRKRMTLVNSDSKLEPLRRFIELLNRNNVVDGYVVDFIQCIKISVIDKLVALASDDLAVTSKLGDLFHKYEDKGIREGIVWSLGRIVPSNQEATKFLLSILGDDTEQLLGEAALYFLEKITQIDLLALVVRHLREYEGFEVEKVLWHCAQNMSYLDFHQAWHSPSSTDSELSTVYGEVKP